VIPPEVEAKVLRLYHAEGWKLGTIARQLGVHHSTVRRVLAQAGIGEGRRMTRPSIADPYLPFIVETLERYPTLPASRLYEMVKQRGYPGGPDYFRAVVARYRPKRPAEAYLRLRTLPGEQAQVDWADFGKLVIGRAIRRLAAFVMILSFSRMLFLRFYLDQKMANFLRAHQEAFEAFGGVPRIVLYDNLKSAVLERYGEAIRFNPELLAFAAHYRYEPRPVAKGRGNEKGRAERAIRYARQSFFLAREWRDIDDLNRQADDWTGGSAAHRPCPEDRTMTVREAFDSERDKLVPLPNTRYPVHERLEVRVGRTPYARFDKNDYSVPHTLVRRLLTVVATPSQVRLLDGNEVVALHRRSYDKGAQMENPEHIADLVAHKRQGRRHRGLDRLYHAAPTSQALLIELAKRGGNLGSATAALLRLLEAYGAVALDAAVAEALSQGTPHPHAVRHVLERKRRERGQPPPIPVDLPDDPRVKGIIVRPHRLDQYDHLRPEPRESHDPDSEP
jgi:transposase